MTTTCSQQIGSPTEQNRGCDGSRTPPDMAANACARGQRHAILASPLRELTGFVLIVDCGAAQCRGEWSYLLTALAACYAPGVIVGKVLRQMRCARGCGGRPVAAWPATGPTLNERVRPRRVALLGPEASGLTRANC